MNIQGKRQHVLIVEDEPNLAHLMAKILKENKTNAIVRRSGRDALRYLEISRTPLDILILDLRLPDMNGLEVLKHCRSLGNQSPGLRIMVVSAFGSPEVKEEALRLGADAFFDKPIQIRTLLDFVANNNQNNQKEENVSHHSKDKE